MDAFFGHYILNPYLPMKNNSLLIVDDRAMDLEIVSMACSKLDCVVDTAQGASEALAKYKEIGHSIILADYQMKPMNGIDLISEIRAINPDAICLIMTAFPDARVVKFVNEMDMSNVIPKPIRHGYLAEQLRIAVNKHRGATKQLGEIAISNRMDQCVALLGESLEISQVRKQISGLINVHRPLFIEGPYGVGKPEVVKFIHNSGPYADSHIVVCSCQDMTSEEIEANLISAEGEWGACIKEAEHGTLVLNHVECIPLEIQRVFANHIKAINEHCRIVSWANALIDDLLDAGEIDAELYFQLTLDSIHLPALSDRPIDIEEIVRFVASAPEEFGLERTMKPLEVDLLVIKLRTSVPAGNLRELIERVKRAAQEIQDATS